MATGEVATGKQTTGKQTTGKKDPRLAALGRFAVAITLFNVLGHTWFGFEQPWAHPLIALAIAYAAELLLETIDAWAYSRPARFRGGARSLLIFLLPAHISALAISMLLYANQRLAPIAFAAGGAIASKYLFRVRKGGRPRHFFNPSNFGITATLLAFPSVGIGMAYMFTENLYGWGDWILPAAIVVSGSLLNGVYTRRLPLIGAWLGGFAVQGVVRSVVFDVPLGSTLLPMTGVAFILFTFYMVPDPSTTPMGRQGQVLFGASVAAVYGLLLSGHVVFTLFYSLTLVCLVRGVGIAIAARRARSLAGRGIELPAEPRLAGAGEGASAARARVGS